MVCLPRRRGREVCRLVAVMMLLILMMMWWKGLPLVMGMCLRMKSPFSWAV